MPDDSLYQNMDKFIGIASDLKIDYKYLFLKDEPKSSAYKDSYIISKPKVEEDRNEKESEEKEASEQIFLFDQQGNVKELSQVSVIINTIRNNPITYNYFFVREDLKKHFG